uniref:Uncharacterized protein n=1 Tax=Trichogramma kaykai TaxID=54128 RepID=A0ABD2X598_9HYME
MSKERIERNELNDIFQSVLLKVVIEKYLSIEDVDDRRRKFCNLMNTSNMDMRSVLREVLKSKSLIPRDDNADYFMKYALKHRSLKIVKLLTANNLNIHEFFFDDGTSALHYLAESSEGDYNLRGETMKLIRFIVQESRENLSDEHGYTCFHAACMAGDEETVRRFISQGVDVDLDTWKRSPLHIAAEYWREEIVEILLENGASPNQLDRERSTPLHALARHRVCDFVACYRRDTDGTGARSVDAIVDLLIAKGANIEARNENGDTPLSFAVSRIDVDVTRSLLKHGASLDGIDEHNVFSCNFEPLQLKNYPWTWKIIEVVQLLQSAGYEMSLLARYRMLKCWLKVRGNDTEHLLPYFIGKFFDISSVIIVIFA